MIRAQQESIDTLKQILTQLLKDKRKSTDKTSSKKSKGKRKEGESSSSVLIEEKEQSNSKSSKFSSKEEENPENRGIHSKRMSQLEQLGLVPAISDRVGLVLYPPKFKALTLQLSTAKDHRTNTSTTSSLRQEM